MKVVVVHDYLTGRGGAERVALALANGLEATHLVTSLYEPEATFRGFADVSVQTSVLNRYAKLRADHRRAFPVLPFAFARLPVQQADVVVCSSSGWAHGIRANAPKIVYCHTPARWLYEPQDYLIDSTERTRQAVGLLSPSLRRWDLRAARSATRYLANSTVVADRIKRSYGIDAEVIHPPPGLIDGPMSAIPQVRPGFYLSVGRDRGYKRVRLIEESMVLLPNERLVTVGSGGSGQWEGNVMHLGEVSDEQLRWLYSNARAVVSAAHEDFGLTLIEGFGFGTPAVVLRGGGFLETMVEGLTGVFIEAAEPAAVAQAMSRLPAHSDTAAIKIHAATFSHDNFEKRMKTVLAEVIAEHQDRADGWGTYVQARTAFTRRSATSSHR